MSVELFASLVLLHYLLLLSKGDQEVQSGYTTAISHRETMKGRRHAAEMTSRRLAQA